MKKSLLLLSLFLANAIVFAIVPKPQSIVLGDGFYSPSKNKTITEQVKFKTDSSIKNEGYKINVTKKNITIEHSSEVGKFYALKTLEQLAAEGDIKVQTIEDYPKYDYRGFMLDVSRYFTPVEEIKKILDALAYHKINKFHWHLVDDNGWRIEIKKYPKLTSVGAFRASREALFPLRLNPMPGEPTPNGGYYSQEDVKEIVQYAAERHIEVIPEIEMPAHSNAALAAYPELTCPVVEEYVGVLPGIGGHNSAIIFCAGKDKSFEFLQDVLDEVMELFPTKYIHIGGDEAWKDNWEKCPLCQDRMKQNNIPNEEELQSYFIRRMNDYIISKGKQLLGWDELVDSELPKDAIIYGWRGLGEGAAKAAKQGHQVVLTPARKFYLIRYQGPQWFESFTYFGNNTLKDVYNYDIKDSGITPELADKIWGLQASMWTEFITNNPQLEAMLFPRLSALAENSWSNNLDWEDYLTRLPNVFKYYDKNNISYSKALFNLYHDVKADNNGKIFATLSSDYDGIEIRYTTDYTEPTIDSKKYEGLTEIPAESFLLAKTFINGKALGNTLKLDPTRSLALGAEVTIAKGKGKGYLLTNGILGSEKFSDGEYVENYDSDVEFTLNLRDAKKFSKIVLHSLINAGMNAQYPSELTVFGSKDGEEYTSIYNKTWGEERFINTFTKMKIDINFEEQQEYQYLKFEIKKPGTCPDDHPKMGQPARTAFDEVQIF